MRLLFIRHGDPDYQTNSLTEQGRREAEALARHIQEEKIDVMYKSPLGRAQETAAYCERELGMTAETLDWLQEFPAKLDINGNEFLEQAYPDTRIDPETGAFRKERIIWDMLPSAAMKDPRYLETPSGAENAAKARDGEQYPGHYQGRPAGETLGWRDSVTAHHSDLNEIYDSVTSSFDALLEKYGYERSGPYYRVKEENRLTIAFFCHYGVTSVLLSHIWNVSPFALFNGICMQTSSVTELVTEEREQGIACLRALRIGDISHLTREGIKPSCMARFTDVYSDPTLRH
jgi:broad specificity phosphatase PhoE